MTSAPRGRTFSSTCATTRMTRMGSRGSPASTNAYRDRGDPRQVRQAIEPKSLRITSPPDDRVGTPAG